MPANWTLLARESQVTLSLPAFDKREHISLVLATNGDVLPANYKSPHEFLPPGQTTDSRSRTL